MDKHRDNHWLALIFAAFGAFFTACAFSLNFSAPSPGTSAVSHAFSHRGMLLGVLFCLFALLYVLFFKNRIRQPLRGTWISSIILGFGYAVGRNFWNEYPLTSSLGQIGKLALAIIGFTIFFWFITHCLFWLLHTPWVPPSSFLPRLRHFFTRHPYSITFTFLLLAWIIPLILHYPAGIYYDVNNELEQGFGLRPYNTGHPLAHILLLTFFVKAGNCIGHPNWGIFTLEIIFALILAAIVTYAVRLLREFRAPWWSYLLVLSFYGTSPWIIGTLGDPTKDIHYATFLFLFVLLLWKLVHSPTQFLNSKKNSALLILSVSAMVLLRNNGTHVAALSLLFLVLYLWKNNRKSIGRALLLCLLCLAIPLFINKTLAVILQPEAFRAGEALSLPLQQSARLIRDHPELITPEEEEVLRLVLPYDHVHDLYDPYSIDRLKDTVRFDDAQEFTPGAEKDYLKVWCREFFRAPATYIAATWQQNLFLFYPETTIHYYYIHSSNTWDKGTYIRQFFSDPPSLIEAKNSFKDYLECVHTTPVLSVLNSFALFTMSIPLLLLFTSQRTYRHLLIPLAPLVLSLLVVVAAPGLMTFPRYAYPIIFTVPAVWALLGAEISARTLSHQLSGTASPVSV